MRRGAPKLAATAGGLLACAFGCQALLSGTDDVSADAAPPNGAETEPPVGAETGPVAIPDAAPATDASATDAPDNTDGDRPRADTGLGCPPEGNATACPTGVTPWFGRCYFIPAGGGNLRPSEGVSFCKDAGGYLATVTCASELIQVNQLIPGTPIALGAMGFDGGATWQWNTGEPFIFSNWQSGEPSSDGGCLAAAKSGPWQATSCGSTKVIVCETGPLTP